jgi:hypothetical protein
VAAAHSPQADAPHDPEPPATAGAAVRRAAIFTRAADAVEEATWSARCDGSAAYGIAVFDVNPGSEAGGQTSVTVRYYHAAGTGAPRADQAGQADQADQADQAGQASGQPGTPAGDCTLFETFTLVRPRSDGRRWHLKD